MIMSKRFIMTLAVICLAAMFIAPLTAVAAGSKTVAAGETWTVTETTKLWKLVIEEGATVNTTDGYSLTMTVNGVETGQALVTTAGVDTAFVPGTYIGNIVLTVAEANPVPYSTLTFPFRQALYIDDTGVVKEKSVPAAVKGGKVTDTYAKYVSIGSTGECFNGIYVAGGDYAINGARISLLGNGRSDFIGYGTAILGTGENTTLVIDGAKVTNKGVVRAAVVADGGANVVVKNSHISTYNGVLPEDYVGTIDTTQMRSIPWMLGASGNVRATNLLGTNTKASYINSYISSEGWGVLSTDGCTTPTLTAINSTIAITGEDGYGSYGIGDATEYFLGCKINVATYSTISRGSFLYYGDSTPEIVSQLNSDLNLGLSAKELNSIRPRPTIVNSKRFGVMWHGGGTLDVSGGTVFNTKEATFLDKGQAITITVDGSNGVRLNPKNGVIMQLMDDDDCGPNMSEGGATTNVYTEPTGDVEVDTTHDVTVADSTDAIATFSNIKLSGNFYNSTRGGIVAGPFGPPSSSSKNLGLTFDNASITGVITASTAVHDQSTITSADYKLLGKVTNTPAAAVNNGVIVSLINGAKWTITGTSYLTSLYIAEGTSVKAPKCSTVAMTVDGTDTTIAAGTYTGNIVLTVTETGNCHYH